MLSVKNLNQKCCGLSPSFSICLWLQELALLEKLSLSLGICTCPTCKVRIGAADCILTGIPRSCSSRCQCLSFPSKGGETPLCTPGGQAFQELSFTKLFVCWTLRLNPCTDPLILPQGNSWSSSRTVCKLSGCGCEGCSVYLLGITKSKNKSFLLVCLIWSQVSWTVSYLMAK